ncbi:protein DETOXIFICATION 43-like isoform X1 [Cucurbita pepo subsp. pepo]|uniref:protein DETOXIFICATION 43-like isoform X1 n=1 Tax=Cucurbita pepo subsp. pepo TaxID=3664 RepID=UPI000C9D6189|nr:protein DETOXIFICATION 43-like isoform X1 [Cucurbita pepo subsp. pepo]XP_023515213.1 protein DETOXIFICATION 43-like isoform X1 [Cucurbita pepo subsp. pepo]XP_023515214.1 protein DETOXIFICATION 43-like isoform X1 [Cucurbita pepo subsp. pepo]
MPVNVFFKDARRVFKFDTIGREILEIALPAALAVAADPVASLIDTAFVGHLGPVELAAVGVSIAIFNQASRITIFPLVSITTSFVAEEDAISQAATKAAKGDKGNCLADDHSVKVNVPEEHEREDSEKLAAKQDSVNMNHEPTKNIVSIEQGAGKENKESSSTKEGTEESGPDNNGALQDLGKESGANVIKSTAAKSKKKEKKQIASASTALIFGSILGLMQAIFLVFGAKSFLNLMGVKDNSPMLAPAHKYLTLRSLGAPAVLLSLAMQGIFRGFKDTRTPLYVIVLGYTVNIILDPILIFVCRWGVKGAAAAHVLSQYFIVLVLFWRLVQKVNLMPPSLKDLQFGRFLKNGGLLLARVIAVTFCVTLAAALAARLGPIPMAAFQTCLQVWMTSSLLSDGLAVAGQAILASAFAEKNYEKITATATRVLQMSFILGVGLAIFVGIGTFFGAGIFSKDIHVQYLIHLGIPFIAATQPINSLAFVFDGVNFGASDFAYSAYSLVSSSGSSSTWLQNLLDRYSVCSSYASGSGVYCERCISVSSLQEQWLHRDLVCFNHLHVSAYVCGRLEDGYRNRTVALPQDPKASLKTNSIHVPASYQTLIL